MSREISVQISSAADATLAGQLAPQKLRWMLAATAAMRQPQALANEVGNALAYAIDPQTARLDPSLGWSLAEDRGFKPSYRELFAMYQRGLDDPRPETDWVPVTPHERRIFIGNVLEFADRQLERKRNSDLELFGIEVLPAVAGQLRPERLLAPYRLIRTPADLQLQLALWADTRRTYRGRPVDRVLAVDPRMLGHLAALRGLRRAAPGRLWLAVPDFRTRIRQRRGHLVAHAALELGRALAADGDLGLLGPGFELSTLIGRNATAISFGTHLADNRSSKTRGGPTPPFGYVQRVHDWVAFDELANVVSGIESSRDFADAFCDDSACVARFAELGPQAFAAEMFGMVRRRVAWVPTPEARHAQRIHALRARLSELALLDLSVRDLIRRLERDASASPFTAAAQRLVAWAMILRADEDLAA